MSRHLLFVLLVASAVALAADKHETQPADGTAAAPKKAEAQRAGERRAQSKTQPTEPATEPPQAKAESAQGQDEQAQAKSNEGSKLTSVPDAKALGMSILGNQDAPKSLVIVPWKSSELGDSPAISPMLDDSRQPVDKEVFMRSLRYYEIRSKTKP